MKPLSVRLTRLIALSSSSPRCLAKKQFRSDRVRSHVPAGIFQIERLFPYRASFRSIPPLKIHCIRFPQFPQPFLERFYAFFSYSNCQVIILYSMMNTKVPKSKTFVSSLFPQKNEQLTNVLQNCGSAKHEAFGILTTQKTRK